MQLISGALQRCRAGGDGDLASAADRSSPGCREKNVVTASVTAVTSNSSVREAGDRAAGHVADRVAARAGGEVSPTSSTAEHLRQRLELEE
jgi:hypothetical protein